MKYSDIEEVENEIINNDYVTVDIKDKRATSRLFEKIKKSELMHDKISLAIIPVMVLTMVSLGFLIAQLAEYASLSAITSILT